MLIEIKEAFALELHKSLKNEFNINDAILEENLLLLIKSYVDFRDCKYSSDEMYEKFLPIVNYGKDLDFKITSNLNSSSGALNRIMA